MARYARLQLPQGQSWAVDHGAGWRLIREAPWASPPVETGPAPAELSLLAPVAPSKILCFARTYPKHAAELGNAVPAEPKLFLKAPSALIGPNTPIRLPRHVERCDPEGEVALVIGSRLTDATVDQARAAVFGVTAVNDVTARDFQKTDGVFGRAKGFDTFCPTGPWIDDELDAADLGVATRVNGEVRASGRTTDMWIGPYELVAWASSVMTLEPGDLISTGTPPGVGPITSGDVVQVEIEGLGALSNPVAWR